MTTAVQGSLTSTYGYDGLGRLSSLTLSSSPGSPTSYWFQGTGTSRVLQTTGSTSVGFAYTPFGPLAQGTPGQASSAAYFLKDLHGDVVGLGTAASASPTLSRSYSPWGEVISSAGASSEIGFQGSPTDPSTGLVETPARYYDPSMARFDTQDSLFGGPSVRSPLTSTPTAGTPRSATQIPPG